MKIFIEINGNYILLTDDVNKDNFKNELIKEEIINNVMDKLEKLAIEIRRHKLNPVKIKKLDVHPSMKNYS